MSTPILNEADWLQRMRAQRAVRPYFAMYSSLIDGIVTDPTLMQVPVDDHLVHRGDGVFETLKSISGRIYQLEAHLDRLATSAAAIGLSLPRSKETLGELVTDTLAAGRQDNASIRILISRGPGSLGVNPYDCPQSQVYIVVGALVRPFMDAHPEGARVGFSQLPPKHPMFASIKTCNYLPNALMAKEARDRGLDFVIGLGLDDRVLEGPTENIAIVSEDGVLRTPQAPDVLPGTTLERVLALAGDLPVARVVLPRSALLRAREIFIIGTSHDIIAVSEFEGGNPLPGPQGPIFQRLAPRLQQDLQRR
jgi:branched-chain amino acid aminotransferase